MAQQQKYCDNKNDKDEDVSSTIYKVVVLVATDKRLERALGIKSKNIKCRFFYNSWVSPMQPDLLMSTLNPQKIHNEFAEVDFLAFCVVTPTT